ncbi:Acg family FMN-binding oxidoreductase [Streptomyces sp. NPDC101165]|uniref:Acg family FMN-binding oxidoreductase n=1 Tax=Streptomyces sp. NPDC101165 TaxID=3366119 RepID=UPI00381557A2
MRTPHLDAASLETLLAAAVAAPSIHNTQPWRFRVDPHDQSLEIRAVPERMLPLADPDSRAQYLSVGAAVFNLRLAAEHLGRRPEVWLLPDPAEPELLATLWLADPTGPHAHRGRDTDLYEAIARRHTSRMPFTGRPVPDPVVVEMTAAAHTQGAQLYLPEIVGTRRLLRLTAVAEARNQASAARTAETRHWITVPGTGAPYGIPVTALGPSDAGGRMPMRDFTGPLPVPRLPALRFERHAQVALLWTSHDRPQDWLGAGQALQHVLLTATVHGVRTSLLHQAMEWPDLRQATSLSRKRCHPQVLIRFGYGPDGGRTPRARGQAVTELVGEPDATRP